MNAKESKFEFFIQICGNSAVKQPAFGNITKLYAHKLDKTGRRAEAFYVWSTRLPNTFDLRK